jgi:ribonuclease P/MRP protein subunit RPP40
VASQVDLGVTVTQDISWTEQTNKAAWKAVGTLNLLKKKLPSPSHSLVSNLYSTYIRPQMDFAITVWRPLYKKDQLLLERVQHAVTRWSPDLSHLPYEERLKILKIPQLEERFDRADLIQMFRLTHNLFHNAIENF